MNKVNWFSKESVIAYAERLGPGMTVFLHPDRDNYNITHTERVDRYVGCTIIHHTK